MLPTLALVVAGVAAGLAVGAIATDDVGDPPAEIVDVPPSDPAPIRSRSLPGAVLVDECETAPILRGRQALC